MACYVTKNISSTGPSAFSNVIKTGLFLKEYKDKKINSPGHLLMIKCHLII